MKFFFETLFVVFKKLIIIYIIVAVFFFCAFFLPEFLETGIEAERMNEAILMSTGISLLMSFVMVTFFCAPIMQWYFMIKFGNKIVDRIEGSEYKSVDNNIYYRDVPTDYDPAIASLILNKWFEKKVDMTSMILYLIKNDYLRKDGESIVYTGKDITGLTESQKYIVEYYFKNAEAFDFIKWRNLVVEEAKAKGYVKEGRSINLETEEFKRKTGKIAIFIIIGVIILNVLNLELLLALLYPMMMPFGVVVLFILAYRRSNVNVELTKKGIEEQEKLVKLRKFLMDFSSLEESNEEAATIWEDYLIYAISLGVNTDIVEKSKLYSKLNYGTFVVNQQLVQDVSNSYINTNFNIKN